MSGIGQGSEWMEVKRGTGLSIRMRAVGQRHEREQRPVIFNRGISSLVCDA